MAQQLPLIQTAERNRVVNWRLDEATREVGRRGIEASRRALQEATQRRLAHSTQQEDRSAA